MPSLPDNMGGGKNPFANMFDNTVDYITEVDSAMNLTVVFQSFNLITKYTALENVVLSMDVAAMCDTQYELTKISGKRKNKPQPKEQ